MNMTEKNGKLILMCTHGPEDPERATIPFVMATAAQASDVDVVIGFQANGVLLIRKGLAEHVFAAGFPPLKELLDIYIENGGKLLVCGPCVKSRQIKPEEEFILGATVVNAATFVKECTEATNVLVY
jgi:predicted peroxiredoxin